MLYYSKGCSECKLSAENLKSVIFEVLEKLGNKKKVLIIPPDFTRFHSRAGEITELAYQFYGDKVTDILPALGTHFPMKEDEIKKMFGEIPLELFREHDWRNDVVNVGNVPAEFVEKISEGKIKKSFPVQINKLLIEGNFDLILSIGQVVPHEVIGMANYNKNIFVGTGGAEGINNSHFLGAVYGMERIMGKADSPVRAVLNYASDNFTNNLPIVYIQTVLSRGDDGEMKLNGVFSGDDVECFYEASKLSLKVNFKILEKPLKKVVVFLDPEEFKSTSCART